MSTIQPSLPNLLTIIYLTLIEKRLRRGLSGHIDPSYEEHLTAPLAGFCADCGSTLHVVKVEEVSDGLRFTFTCGHGAVEVEVNETLSLSEAFNIATIGDTAHGQEVWAQYGGVRPNKATEEVMVVEKFSRFGNYSLRNIRSSAHEDDIADIIAESQDDSRLMFQVTRLYDSSFWEFFYGKSHEVRRVYEGLAELIRKALVRKALYDPNESQKTILLIDTQPGISERFLQEALPLISDDVQKTQFKEIWLVGNDERLTVRLHPPCHQG